MGSKKRRNIFRERQTHAMPEAEESSRQIIYLTHVFFRSDFFPIFFFFLALLNFQLSLFIASAACEEHYH
jgi:hypothetical protein